VSTSRSEPFKDLFLADDDDKGSNEESEELPSISKFEISPRPPTKSFVDSGNNLGQ
jgi:hypothetical protein